MANLKSLIVSYATEASSSAAFTSQTWSYSTDGVNWTSADYRVHVAAAILEDRFWEAHDLGNPSLSSLNNASTAYLRVQFNGATGSGGNNNRLDNIQFNAISTTAPLPVLGSDITSGAATFSGAITLNGSVALYGHGSPACAWSISRTWFPMAPMGRKASQSPVAEPSRSAERTPTPVSPA